MEWYQHIFGMRTASPKILSCVFRLFHELGKVDGLHYAFPYLNYSHVKSATVQIVESFTSLLVQTAAAA